MVRLGHTTIPSHHLMNIKQNQVLKYENKEIKKENTKLKVENKQLKNEVNNLQTKLEEKVQVPEPKPHSHVTPHVESYDLSTE